MLCLLRVSDSFLADLSSFFFFLLTNLFQQNRNTDPYLYLRCEEMCFAQTWPSNKTGTLNHTCTYGVKNCVLLRHDLPTGTLNHTFTYAVKNCVLLRHDLPTKQEHWTIPALMVWRNVFCSDMTFVDDLYECQVTNSLSRLQESSREPYQRKKKLFLKNSVHGLVRFVVWSGLWSGQVCGLIRFVVWSGLRSGQV